MNRIFQSFETERLLIRPWKHGDLGDLYEYASQPEVGPLAGWEPHRSKEESIYILNNAYISNPTAWAIMYKADAKVIGGINLRNDERRTATRCFTLGYSISKDYWNQGIRSEAAPIIVKYAFDEMQARLLSVYHYPHNLRSKRIIEKCGFHYEGTLRCCAQLFNGEIYDECCYSMTRQEFSRAKRHAQ